MGMAHLCHGEGVRRAHGAGRLARAEMIVRIGRRLLSADVLGLLLVSAALQALTYGIASSLRNTDTRQSAYFFWICLLAALIAFRLSKRHGDGILASVWMIVLGILGTWILSAR